MPTPRSWSKVLAVVASLATALACGGDPTGSPGPPSELAGTWFAIGSLRSADGRVECADSVRVTIGQAGGSAEVSAYHYGACVLPGGAPGELSMWQEDPAATVQGARIRFRDDNCVSSGTFDALTGTVAGTTACERLFVGSAFVERVRGAWTMHRADFAPPTLTLSVTPEVMTHGDTLRVTVTATDATALAWIADSIHLERALEADCAALPPVVHRDTLVVSGREASVAFAVSIPWCTSMFVRAVALAADTAGNVGLVTSELVRIDPPSSAITGGMLDTVLTGGATARISVTAENPRGLSWIGIRSDAWPPTWAESIAVTGTTASHIFLRPTPEVEATGAFGVHLFARHALGHRTEVTPPWTRLTDARMVPVERLVLPRSPGDVVIDPVADVVYLADPSEPVLRVLSLQPFSVRPAIALPAVAGGIDLSVAGDSLLVALGGQRTIAVVETAGGAITQLSLAVDSLPEPLYESVDLKQVRVLADGQALLAIASGTGGHLFSVDLGTGGLMPRSGWFSAGAMSRSGDRAHLFTDAQRGLRYSAAADDFAAPVAGAISQLPGPRFVDVSHDATTVMVRCATFTRDLVPVRSFARRLPIEGGVAVSSDGRYAYCARQDGVEEFSTESGAWLRAFWLPVSPTWIRALAGDRLLVGAGSAVYLIPLPAR